jgi:hypothetical protein
MNLPDTFAGGAFNLSLKVAKMVRLAESTDSVDERTAAINKIWGFNYFLDRANIIWDKDKVPEFAKDDIYRELISNQPPLKGE